MRRSLLGQRWRYCATGILAVALATALAVTPAGAHHPGQQLEAMMGSKEKYFQAIDKPAPEFALGDADGRVVSLSEQKGKVVVLHFIYASCPDVCPLHADKIAEVQAMVNASPMKYRVQFISVTTDPDKDSADILRGYGPVHGLDGANWTFLTTTAGQPEGTTRFESVNLVLYVNALTNEAEGAEQPRPKGLWERLRELF